MNISLKVFLILIFYHFTDGKQCPEKFRPHTTRCDSYFKCIILPSGSHVWVPTRCERGLVYESNLRLCVLPGDDWECNLGEDDALPNRYGSNNNTNNNLELYPAPKRRQPVRITKYEENDGNGSDGSDFEKDEFFEVKSGPFSNILVTSNVLDSDEEDKFESSGDGDSIPIEQTELYEIEMKEDSDDGGGGGIELPMESKIDPKLTTQLQHLSQLVNGLKDTYQNKNPPSNELRPDQLNAFLAHYNLRTEFDAISPDYEKQQIPENGRIEPNILREIIQKQQKLNNRLTMKPSNTNVRVSSSSTSSTKKNGPIVKVGQGNKKIVVHTKKTPNNSNGGNNGGYSNSQIVVNRPEGSVTFSFPGHKDKYYELDAFKNSPKISEETLKTVLELSRQMIANQNVRQVISTSNYGTEGFYHPVVQSLIYPIPIASSAFQNGGLPQISEVDGINYEKIASSNYISHYPARHKPTTIIQNSVIPVHINSASKTSANGGFSSDEISNSNQHLVDSYGNKIPNYIEYPPYREYSTPTTTEKPTLPHQATPSYYTPSPHLDDATANNVVSIERYPTLPYLEPNHSGSETKYPQNFHQTAYFPQIDPSSVKIRPNSYALPESGELQLEQNQHDDDNVNKQQKEDHQQQQYHHHHQQQQQQQHHQIVSDQLAPNVDQHHANSNGASSQPTSGSTNKLVNLGGSFISFDIYKNQILPALSSALANTGDSYDFNKIEVITCSAAVRQPNTTDCTKYYVCSKKDGKVLSYSCPPYTAFNPQTRICDAKIYAICNPQALYNRFTVSENRKIQMEALQALQQAQRIRNEAMQAQNLANLIRLQTQQVINSTITDNNDGGQPQMLQEPTIFVGDFVNSNDLTSTTPTTTTPTTSTALPPPLVLYGHKRRKYYCKEGDKIPDQTSVLNYYVCYKNKDGIMKGHRMTCSPGLMFCAKTALCTLPRKCNA